MGSNVKAWKGKARKSLHGKACKGKTWKGM
jgi:hypothetical protein